MIVKTPDEGMLKKLNPTIAGFCILDVVPVSDKTEREQGFRKQTVYYLIRGNEKFHREHRDEFFGQPDRKEKTDRWHRELGNLLYGMYDAPYLCCISDEDRVYVAHKRRVVPVVPTEDQSLIRIIQDPEECVIFERPAFTVLSRGELQEQQSETRIDFMILPNRPMQQLIEAAQKAFLCDFDFELGQQFETGLKTAMGLKSWVLYGMKRTGPGAYSITFGRRKVSI